MFTAEIYPTNIRQVPEILHLWNPPNLATRQTAIGTFSMTARVGGIAAPYIALYLPKVCT